MAGSALRRAWETCKLRLRGKAPAGELQQLWQALPRSYGKPWYTYHFLCIDLEFSHLNSAKGELLSMGWVHLSQGRLQLQSARHYLVKNHSGVGQSATIHAIRDIDAAQGIELTRALGFFLRACLGKILIFHCAPLDLSYLNKICRQQHGSPLLLPYCDTFALEKRKLMRSRELIGPRELRLQACRDRYHLPPYPPHHAAIDAQACGELFLAQVSEKAAHIPLAKLLS